MENGKLGVLTDVAGMVGVGRDTDGTAGTDGTVGMAGDSIGGRDKAGTDGLVTDVGSDNMLIDVDSSTRFSCSRTTIWLA